MLPCPVTKRCIKTSDVEISRSRTGLGVGIARVGITLVGIERVGIKRAPQNI